MNGTPAQGPSDRPPALAAFAVDLDRTLLPPGEPLARSASTLLGTVQKMGLKVVLVSGREYDRLAAFARKLRAVDALVAENGAVIEAPLGGAVTRVAGRSAARARDRLVSARISGLETGLVVVSVPRALSLRVATLLAGLPVALIPNADRVMVLPRGVTKASGMQRALRGLRLGSRAYAAIGDGENDLDLLRAATLSAAVANAHPSVRSAVNYLCHAPFEAGVAEFVRGPLARCLQVGPPSRRPSPRRPRSLSSGPRGARGGVHAVD